MGKRGILQAVVLAGGWLLVTVTSAQPAQSMRVLAAALHKKESVVRDKEGAAAHLGLKDFVEELLATSSLDSPAVRTAISWAMALQTLEFVCGMSVAGRPGAFESWQEGLSKAWADGPEERRTLQLLFNEGAVAYKFKLLKDHLLGCLRLRCLRKADLAGAEEPPISSLFADVAGQEVLEAEWIKIMEWLGVNTPHRDATRLLFPSIESWAWRLACLLFEKQYLPRQKPRSEEEIAALEDKIEEALNLDYLDVDRLARFYDVHVDWRLRFLRGFIEEAARHMSASPVDWEKDISAERTAFFDMSDHRAEVLNSVSILVHTVCAFAAQNRNKFPW